MPLAFEEPGRDSRSSSLSSLNNEGHSDWAQDAFETLCGGPGSKLTVDKIWDRTSTSWLRAFISDVTSRGDLPPSRRLKTTQVASLLAAKARGAGERELEFMPGDTGLTVDEGGAVLDVDQQAKYLGVRPRWRLLRIGGQTYSAYLLDQMTKGTQPYTIAFYSEEDSHISFEDFDSCTRALSRPTSSSSTSASARIASTMTSTTASTMAEPEEELCWALLDTQGEGGVQIRSAAPLLRAMWSAIGVPDSGKVVEELIAATERDGGWLTAETYRSSLRAACSNGRAATARPTPREVALGLRPYGTVTDWDRSGQSGRHTARARDCILRSRELAGLSMYQYSGGRANIDARILEPSLSTHRKRPGKLGRVDVAAGRPRGPQAMTTRLPTMSGKAKKKNIDWEAQEQWWGKKKNRMVPYMPVKVSYVDKHGKQVDDMGTLLSGWGQTNLAFDVPHSKPPQSARLGERRKQKEPEPAIPVGLEDWVKVRDEEHFVVVLVHGVERLVPRKWVSAVG